MPLLSLVSGHICGSFFPVLEFLTSNESYWDKIERHHRTVASSEDGIYMVLAKKRKEGRKKEGERKKIKEKELKIKLNA